MNDALLYVYSMNDGIEGIDTIHVRQGEIDWSCRCGLDEAAFTIVYPTMSTLTVFGGSGKVAELEGSALNLNEVRVSGTKENEDYTRLRALYAEGNRASADSARRAYVDANPGGILTSHLMHEEAAGQLPAGLRKGTRLPKFALRMRSGRTLGSAQLRGKFVLLTFWACWKEHSYRLNADIRRLRRRVTVPLECISYSLDVNTVQLAETERMDSISWHSFCDKRGFASDLASRMGVREIPYFVLADGRGVIVESSTEFADIERVLLTNNK